MKDNNSNEGKRVRKPVILYNVPQELNYNKEAYCVIGKLNENNCMFSAFNNCLRDNLDRLNFMGFKNMGDFDARFMNECNGEVTYHGEKREE